MAIHLESRIPEEKVLDSTISLLREGYTFIASRCERFQSDIFKTRIMLKPAICMRGGEAAAIFYDGERFQRKHAVPLRIQYTLVGRKGVQTLDDDQHHQRKAVFMSLMTPAGIGALVERVKQEWMAALPAWQKQGRIILFDETQNILCRATCAWAGIPIKESEVHERAQDMIALIYSFGRIGLPHWKGRIARRKSNRWMGGIIEQLRSGKIKVPEGSAAHRIAFHTEPDGKLLDTKIAAVELINVLRPIVAISTYIVFIAHALYKHPEWQQRLRAGDEKDRKIFVQEVRRFYPFTPFVGACVRHAFDWNGCHFPKGHLVLLDAYATDHDPKRWKSPETFMPERFLSWQENPFDLIPQGGGDHHKGHRCAGEWITIAIMKLAADLLVNHMQYEVPPQEMHIPLNKIPTLPNSGIMLERVEKD